jgi:hypothetical protein
MDYWSDVLDTWTHHIKDNAKPQWPWLLRGGVGGTMCMCIVAFDE